ncbi:hypothetical protein SUGI_0752220 [Cryptomeria japonica]|nr:hypothetical protein SUGI_0752220 [Cryptomeria japonica]
MALLRIHLLLIAVSFVATADDNNKMHAEIYRNCSDAEYNEGSPYQNNLNTFLESVASEERATSSFFYKQRVGQLYGVFQCRGDVSEEECRDCKRVVAMRATVLCGTSVGARLQLRGCFLRYGNSKFFSAPGEQLVYKACSPETTTDPGFFSKRDNVLSGLEQGSFSGNNFRVTSSGDSNEGPPIYGYAQCEGDLSWPECADCVLNAATDLKRICPNSVSGQVYLQKCYVSYTQGDSHSHHDTEANHVTAKTVAIVIGGVAAIIFTFIFLMFLKSICKQDD